MVYGLRKYFPREFEVEVAAGVGDGRLERKIRDLGIRYHHVPHLVREVKPFYDILALFELVRLMKENKYDVVHLHSSKAAALGRIAAKLAGVKKVVYTIHGFWGIEQYKGWKRYAVVCTEKLLSKLTDRIVLLCERDLEKAKRYGIGNPRQYVIIPNTVILEHKPIPGSLRKELGIPENVKIVGNIARLDKPKNPLRFLRIASEILKVRDDVVFVWIGGAVVNDGTKEEVEEFLERETLLREKVYFMDFREDATKFLGDFDVFLLTSDSEGMPLVVLEALKAGVPVISTDVGCVREMIGENSVSSSEERLVELLLESLDQPKRAETKITNYEDFINSYERLFRSL